MTDEISIMAARWKIEDSVLNDGCRTSSTARTKIEDLNAMTLQVAELIGLEPSYIRHKVEAAWEDGITFAAWMDKVVPTTQPLQGIWL